MGINFDNLPLDELIDLINLKIKKNEKLTIGYINVYICNYVRKHSGFQDLQNSFSYVHPDGIGIYLASRFLYGKKGLSERITGTDLYIKLFKENPGLKYFILGGFENCSERITENAALYSESTAFKITGNIYKPGDNFQDVETINKSGADVLLVALGTPYQEEWISENKDKINIPIVIAIGSGLYFLSGTIKRAPEWMRNIGLEWFYRLFQEPKRLWRRYIIGIPIFVFNIIVIKVKLLFKKEST
jgi:N-acetylglucosaminyldiphosphoundecaprenol N-acetyl-beta-D-mannosaminyltransferase